MTCVYKEYKVKTKMVQEQLLQLKMKFLLGFYWFFYWAVIQWWGLSFGRGSQLGVDFSRWGDEQIFSWRGRGTHPSPSRENPDQF